MNEQLIVKNFGPIKDATVDFKRVTVFIGPTGGGKSTLAKLAAVFRNDYWQTQDIENEKKTFFDGLLNGYQISDYLKSNGLLEWRQSDASVIYTEGSILHNNELSKRQERYRKGQRTLEQLSLRLSKTALAQLLNAATPEEIHTFELMQAPDVSVCYIPADRAFSAALASGLAGLTLNHIAIPETLLHFLNEFNKAQNRLYSSPLEIPFLQVSYRMLDKQPRLDLGPDGTIELGRSASGMQAVVPMMLVIKDITTEGFTPSKYSHSFIIEEPELNLYPNAQQGLLDWLVEKCTKGENDLTITTHSPYILSHLNLLLYAYQVAEKHPDRAEEVAELVPRASWINPKEFACYQVENGGVTSLVSEDLGLIDDNGLDNLSGDAADAFDNLIRLSKGMARK